MTKARALGLRLVNALHDRYGRRNPRSIPICLFCYHKSGTVLLSRVFRELSWRLGWRFAILNGRREGLVPATDVMLFTHSLVDLARIDEPFIGIHLIRDPRDIVTSGYLYHLRTQEPWCTNTDFQPTPPITYPRVPLSQEHRAESWKAHYLDSLNGRSYQQNLRDLNAEDGLAFEMSHYGAWTIESMLAWDYDHPKVLELRLENLMGNFDSGFSSMFQHIGLSGSAFATALRIAQRHDLGRKSASAIARMPHVTSAEPSKWQNHFTPRLVEEFKQLHGPALLKLGYETSNDW